MAGRIVVSIFIFVIFPAISLFGGQPSMEIISTDPPSPAVLEPGQMLYVKFRYDSGGAEKIQVWVRPDGSPPSWGAHPCSVLKDKVGEYEGWFYFKDGNAEVKSLRLEMKEVLSGNKRKSIFHSTAPVDFKWKSPKGDGPYGYTAPGTNVKMISTKPALPAVLKPGEKFTVKFKYNTGVANSINIGALPDKQKDDKRPPGIKFKSDDRKGNATQWEYSFSYDEPVSISRIRFRVIDKATNKRIIQYVFPVDVTWTEGKGGSDQRVKPKPLKKVQLSGPALIDAQIAKKFGKKYEGVWVYKLKGQPAKTVILRGKRDKQGLLNFSFLHQDIYSDPVFVKSSVDQYRANVYFKLKGNRSVMYSLAMNKEILAGTVYSSWKDASKVTLRKLTTAQAIDAIESNSRKIKRLTGQLEKSQANAENEKKQREQLHERLKELEAASAKVMRQNRELQRSYQVLKKKQAVLEQKYKTESEKMRKELEGSKKENKKLSDQLTKTKKENTALEEKLKKSYEKIKELDEEKKSHAKQIEKLEITEELFYLATRHYSDHAKLTESLFYFARKYWRSQEYDKAGDLYRYVSNNYPDRDLAIKAQAWYVRCKIKMDNETAAKKAINTLKNDYSQHKDLYAELFSLSDEYRDKKDYVRAKALCRYVSDNSTNTKLTSRATGWVSIYEIKLDNETAARQTTDAFWEKYSSTEDFAEKVNIIAGTLRKQGFYKRGIELCQRLLDSGSNKKVQLIANTGIVKSYLQSGDHIKAEELLDRICADFAGHEELGEALFGIYKNYFYSAFSHISKKPDEKGCEVLQKCLTILQRIIINCPGDKYVGKAFAKRAICYSKLDDEANAKAAIERLIEEAKDIPDLTRTFYFASEDYYYLKNYEYTKKFALKSIEYSKNSKDPKASHFAGLSAYMIVLCADKSKDKATQKEYLHLIMEKYPKSHFASRVPNELGRLYRKQKDYEQAIYWFTQQRELYDDRDSGRSATFHLGVTYAKMLDDHAKAAEVFENHMKWYPSSSKEFIYILLATSYDKLGRKADAIAVLNDALERCRYKSYAKRYKELINKIQEGAKQ